MRGLIRPALLWVARLGLLLTVGFWGAGQWWGTQWRNDSNPHLLIQTDMSGWCISNAFVFSRPSKGLDSFPVDEMSDHSHEFCEIVKEVGDASLFSSLPGFALAITSARRFTIYIAHWLIALIFALVYGVLKWVYRKREVPDEG